MRRPWTPEEDAELRRLYPHYPTALIATEFGRVVGGVYQRAAKLGLSKSAEYVEQEKARAAKRLERDGAPHRFVPGQRAHNKGRRMSAATRAKVARTMFKPGRPASEARNYLPIGTERVTSEGYVERKLTDDPALVPARRWRCVHVLLWEKHNGPVPDGHAVIFRNGNKRDIRLDNLALVSRAELMARNSVHNYPEPIKRAMRAKARLTRVINERTQA